ncbi:hypothetical protein [Schaedlerella sp.]|uniref:hypothetical protein n=1 Tax=Schaedlerella sp. TaxID=2676057 RepID=UPI003526DBC0
MTAGQTKYQTANKNKKINGNHGFGTKLVNGEYHIHDGAGSDKISSAYTVDADSLAQYQDALEQELFLRSRNHPLENKIEEKGEPVPSVEEYDYESISKTFLEILGVKLDTKINWNADGTSELTEDQIQYLQEKYDVENMSKSEFYNLMAELSGMNVISHKDVENQFLRHEDPAVAAKGFVIIAANEHFSQWLNSGNNYLSRFQNEERMYDDWIQALLDERSSVQGSDILKARSYYEEQKESSGRLAGIFEKLKTNRNGRVKKTRNDGLEILGSAAPGEVKDAWSKAEKESGLNGMAMNAEAKPTPLSYTQLRAPETSAHLICRILI